MQTKMVVTACLAICSAAFAQLPTLPGTPATFAGISRCTTLPCTNGTNFDTPNPDGAAGLTQYVEYVNDSYAVYQKDGTQIQGPTKGTNLYSNMIVSVNSDCSTQAAGDVVMRYDKAANRWIFSTRVGKPATGTPYTECFAVSETSDATGLYYGYQWQLNSMGTLIIDYPKLGVWPDSTNNGYYYSYNATGGGYLCALDRANMLTGATPKTPECQASVVGGISIPPTTLPADFDGTMLPSNGTPEYFVGLGGNYATCGPPNNNCTLKVFSFAPNWSSGTPTVTLLSSLALGSNSFTEACSGFSQNVCITQSGTTQKLDSVGDRLMYRLAYRNFGSYESMTVGQSTQQGSSTPYYSAARWYEIRNTSGTISINQLQDFTNSGSDSNFRWLPSIAQDKIGDMLMGYSEGSSSLYPTIAITGRVPSDTASTMEGEQVLLSQTALGYQFESGLNDYHWGPSSSMTVDPADDCTFWFVNSYIPSAETGTGHWATLVVSYKFDGCNKRVFASSGTWNGNLGGVTGADALCQTAAQNAKLGGTLSTWKAWISDSTHDAISRLTDVGPWYLPNQTTKVLANLTSVAPLVAAINMTENSATLTSGSSWTGTNTSGTHTTSTCSAWGSTTGLGTVGNTQVTNGTWTQNGTQGCSSSEHLYCFEQ